MLLSMTGHGDAHGEGRGIRVVAEIRSVNGRFFKFSLRAIDAPLALEGLLEPLVREVARRGTVGLSLRIERESPPSAFRIRAAVISSYRRQLREEVDAQAADSVPLATLLMLPGAVEEPAMASVLDETQTELVLDVVRRALDQLQRARRREGEAMAVDLRDNLTGIRGDLERIAERAPRIVEGYRDRLVERIQGLLADFPVKIGEADVVREVGMFAERTDISEEIVRLRSHLVEFERVMADDESSGRKLDFVVQEMFREVNTIGSKANDAEVARRVIECKNRIERMREMVQNVE